MVRAQEVATLVLLTVLSVSAAVGVSNSVSPENTVDVTDMVLDSVLPEEATGDYYDYTLSFNVTGTEQGAEIDFVSIDHRFKESSVFGLSVVDSPGSFSLVQSVNSSEVRVVLQGENVSKTVSKSKDLGGIDVGESKVARFRFSKIPAGMYRVNVDVDFTCTSEAMLYGCEDDDNWDDRVSLMQEVPLKGGGA